LKQYIKSADDKSWEIEFSESWKVDHIGIHAAPGSTFKINGTGGICVNGTGIVEINLEGMNKYVYLLSCSENMDHPVLIDISGKGVEI
jgi:hypothetical protein